MATEKASVGMFEDEPRKLSLSAGIDSNAAKHGDRALAYIGDERVSLTEEDVRIQLVVGM